MMTAADTLLDQLTHLRAALDAALDSRRHHHRAPGSTDSLYWKQKYSWNTIKKAKEQCNAKLKSADIKRKLTHLTPKPQKKLTYEQCINYSGVGRVKKITDYFEHISKNSVENKLRIDKDHWRSNDCFSKFNLNATYNKTIPRIKKPVIARSPANFHSEWKDALKQSAHCRGVQSTNMLSSVGDSLRLLLLHYIM
ncbi:uncharacterized protein LOC133527789 isoform X1 [Cydia pomonella]|uniref:uncharacterized protein LOC133527789 isoform X1 n=1 Tax=Cydia pomonella TaxID=82600 RepID=UPI002ADE2303|nr:uncharacterized protein LOC133527789 isoform X1 [Cydia pomonella]